MNAFNVFHVINNFFFLLIKYESGFFNIINKKNYFKKKKSLILVGHSGRAIQNLQTQVPKLAELFIYFYKKLGNLTEFK